MIRSRFPCQHNVKQGTFFTRYNISCVQYRVQARVGLVLINKPFLRQSRLIFSHEARTVRITNSSIGG